MFLFFFLFSPLHDFEVFYFVPEMNAHGDNVHLPFPFPNCVVRNTMAVFQSVSKQFQRGRSFPEGTFFSQWRTRIQISSGSPITLRYHLCSFIFMSCKKNVKKTVAIVDDVSEIKDIVRLVLVYLNFLFHLFYFSLKRQIHQCIGNNIYSTVQNL